MTEFVAGGRRRIDRVLEPHYLDNLSTLSLDEVRERRHDADQEEADLSYARRLIQGRLDILRAEQASRRGEGPLRDHPRSDAEIVAALKEILADSPREDHGLGRMLNVTPSRIGENRREAERAVADIGASDPTALTDEQLDEVIARLSELEERLSRSRRQVQHVVDALADELTRRFHDEQAHLADQA